MVCFTKSVLYPVHRSVRFEKRLRCATKATMLGQCRTGQVRSRRAVCLSTRDISRRVRHREVGRISACIKTREAKHFREWQISIRCQEYGIKGATGNGSYFTLLGRPNVFAH